MFKELIEKQRIVFADGFDMFSLNCRILHALPICKKCLHEYKLFFVVTFKKGGLIVP
ncbi:MAG: hypothetical protein H6Q68_4057 [Firmicutes bacterium]|nr:hypothetical protein [Bacillota bacterium]